MTRYRYNSRLFKDSLEKKEHFKMYKKGKLWLVAGISVFTSGLSYTMLASHEIHADTTATTTSSSQNTATTTTAQAGGSATATATKPETATQSSSETTPTPTATTTPSEQAASSTTGTTTTGTTSSSTSQQTADANQSSTSTSSATTDQATNQSSSSTQTPTNNAADQSQSSSSTTDQTTQKTTDSSSSQATKTDDSSTSSDVNTDSSSEQTSDTQNNDQINDDSQTASSDSNQTTDQSNAFDQSVTIGTSNGRTTDSSTTNTPIASTDAFGNNTTDANTTDQQNDDSTPSADTPDATITNDPSSQDTDLNTDTAMKMLNNLSTQMLSATQSVVPETSANQTEDSASLTLSGPDGASVIDSDGNMTIDQTKANALQGSTITLSFNISGNKGDKFFITVPNLATWTDHSIATQTTNSDGSSTVVWTIDKDGSTKNETLTFTYGGNYAFSYDNIAKSPDTGKFIPGGNGTSQWAYNGTVPDGVILPITYGGTNVNTQYKKVTFTNKQNFAGLGIYSQLGNTVKKAGQNYIYSFKYAGSNDFNNMGVLTTVIDLPSNFVFDPDETDYIQKNSFRAGIDVNTFKVLDGNKLQITVGGKNGFTAFSNGSVYFAGHYLDGTTGSQTFKIDSLSSAYMPGTDGKAPIVADNGGEKQFATSGSDYNSGHTYNINSEDYPNLSYTDTIATKDVTNLLTGSYLNSTNTVIIGSTKNNVLGNFTLANFGNTTIDPVYTFKIPDGVESTGINLPLNEAGNTNWPKDTTYNVTVNYSDNTNQTFTNLADGTTVSSIAGKDVQLMTTPAGAHVTSYVVTQSNPIQPNDYLGYFGAIGNGGEAYYVGSNETNDNDAMTYAFTILGNVGTDPSHPVTDGQKLTIEMDYRDKDSNYASNGNLTLTATKDASTELTLGTDQDLPASLAPGQIYTTTIGASFANAKDNVLQANLNANAYRDSQGKVVNQPSDTDPNDQQGFNGNSRSIFEPVIYITTPAQMKLVTDSKTGLPITEDGAGWKGVQANPKVSSFVNKDGLTVTKLDYTGTGFDWTPINQNMQVSFQVDSDAVSSFVPWNSSTATGDGNFDGVSYVDTKDFSNSGLTASNNAATKFGTSGESVAVVMVQGNQLSNAMQTSQADLQNLYIETADGQKITGLSAIQNYHPTSNGAALLTNNPSLAGNLYISAAQTMNLTGAIQGNQQTGTNDYAVSPDSGVNKAVANDAQKIRLRLTNNTAQESDNVAGIINLPTTSTPNNGNTQGTFALQLTGPVTEGKSAAGVSTKTLYSTSPLILSSDGNSVTLANGHTYYFDSTDKNTTTADDLVEASAVKDWSKIVGVVTVIPKLAAHDTADVILPVKDPTSADDAGKKVTIPTYFRAAGSFKNVYGSIVDSFETTAAIKNVDQDGNPINGFPGSTVSGLVDSTIANSAPTIPGYVFVNTEGPKTISLDTSNNVVINHYQVSKADLKSNDKVIEEATGDSAKNTGAATATGTNTITFTTTDADLAKGGSYTVTGPDSKTYATLADALKANSTFDQKSDVTAPTQVFTVSYTKSNVNKGDVAVQGATKVYDGDASTDPVTYNVKLADGINAPTAGWVANDFDTSGIKSQDVGSYTITLSQQGLADLQKANASKNITMAAVTTGQFTITKAPITITAPSVTKVYDGKAYQGALTPAITGKPANGTDIQYTTTDISKDTDVGNYPINITATDADNPNYQITVKAGALTITPKDQTDAIVQNATKTYDVDASTDPTTYNVVLANGVKAPTWAADDFDTSGITSQNAGTYNVTLSAAGLKKLQDTNPNYKITNANVIGGTFTITPAQVTVNAPYLTKIYDGKAYSGDVKATVAGQPAKGDAVKYTLGDLSKDIDAGTYDVGVTANAKDNPNYVVTVNPGKLFITPKGTYTPVIVQGTQKVYDNDATTDPATYGVELPDGITAPKWSADDFNTTGITSQNAGSYSVTLSDKGIADLQAANPNYHLASISAGIFTITKAPITITVPSVTKDYDGKPYSDKINVDVSGKPAKGDDVNYQLNDLSNDTEPGTYDIDATANNNPNYNVTVKNGKLIINDKGATDNYTLTVNYVDGDDNNKTISTSTSTLKDGADYSTDAKVIDGYYLKTTPSNAKGTIDKSNVTVTYVYGENGKYIITPPDGGNPTDVVYPNDPKDPSKVVTPDKGIVPDKPGYTPVDPDGNPLKPVDPNDPSQGYLPPTVPSNPGQDTNINYKKNNNPDTDTYTVTANYVDQNGNKLADPVVTQNVKTGDKYSSTAKVVTGYYLTTMPSNADGTVAKGDVTINYVYSKLGDYIITPPDGSKTTNIVYPNDPKDPTKADTPTTGIVPNKPGYTPVDNDGNALKPVDPNDPTKGYLPPTVPSNPGTDTPIYYHKDGTADTYHVLVNYVDKNGNSVADSTTDPKAYAKGDQYKTSAKIVFGYHLVTTPSNASGTIDASGVTVNYIYAKNGDYIITPPDGGKATNVIYPNDPTDPSKADTPTSGIVPNQPGYTPVDPDGNPLKPVDPDDPTKGYLPPTVPNDPSQDTPISYKKNNTPSTDTYTVTANYVDQNGKQIADPAVVAKNAKDGDKYTSTAKVIDGYYLTATPSNASGTVAKGDVTINYVYNKIGSYIITPPDGGKTTNIVYPNDPKDPTKVDTPTSGIVPNKPGYTPVDGNGNDLKPVDPNDPSKGYLPPTVPSNPSQDTPIYYHKDGTADTYHVTVNYLDQAGNQIAGSTTDSKDYSVGDAYSTTPKVVDGYHLTNTPVNASGKMVKGGEVVNYIYAKNGSYIVTPPDGGKPTDIIYPNDPNDPKKADTPTDGVIPNVPGYHPTDDHGNPLTPVDPNDHSKGYLPPAVPDNPSDDTPIKYVPDTPATTNDNLTVNYVDESGNKVAGSLVQSYKDGASYSTSAKVISGYYLINTPSNASGTIVKGGNSVTYIYRAIGKYVITPPAGKGNITNVVYPNDPTNPREITTPNYGVVPYIPGYTPVDSKGNNLTPVDPNDLSKGYLPPAAPTAQPDLNTYITYKNTGSNNGGGSNNNGGGSNNNGGNSNNNGGSSNNGGGSSNNNGGTTPNGGNAGGNTTPSSNNNGGTSGKTTTGGDKVTKLTPTKGKTSGIVPTALTNRGNGTPTASNTGYNGYNGGGAVAGGSSNGGQMTNQATTGNGGGQSAGTAGTTQAAAGQTNANNGIQYPSSRLPQTGDAENKGTVILGVIGMLSTLGLAALRRKKREQD